MRPTNPLPTSLRLTSRLPAFLALAAVNWQLTTRPPYLSACLPLACLPAFQPAFLTICTPSHRPAPLPPACLTAHLRTLLAPTFDAA